MKFIKFIGKLIGAAIFVAVVTVANNPLAQQYITEFVLSIIGK